MNDLALLFCAALWAFVIQKLGTMLWRAMMDFFAGQEYRAFMQEKEDRHNFIKGAVKEYYEKRPIEELVDEYHEKRKQDDI